MIELSVTNAKNETFMLTGNEAKYQLLNVEGLNPPETIINISTLVGVDGGRLNSLRGETRNIVLTIKINGDVEQNRLQLYRYFNRKAPVTLNITTETRSVSVIGYIDTFTCDLFSNAETAQISIICPSPYFTALTDDLFEISATTNLFKFPFSITASDPVPLSIIQAQNSFTINNPSTIAVGIKIYILFSAGAQATTATSVTVTNGEQSMDITYNFVEGDELKIDTIKGEKTVKLIREGIEYNILSQMSGDFIQLEPGQNTVAFEFSDSANIARAYFTFRKVYEAI